MGKLKPINIYSLRAEQRQGFFKKYYPRHEGGDFLKNPEGLTLPSPERVVIFFIGFNFPLQTG
jgi:hypothetical protein